LDHGRRVSIVEPASLAWEAKIEENDFYKNTNPSYMQTSVFHGHSKSGNVTGPLIYANYGSTMDFAKLSSLKINVTGAVVLVRYGGLDPGSKIRAAEQAGAVGCIMYSDPSDNSFLSTKDWPEKARSPDDAVERGAVSFGSIMAGDVLTPGKPAIAKAARIKPAGSDILPKIPSLPLVSRSHANTYLSLNNTNTVDERCSCSAQCTQKPRTENGEVLEGVCAGHRVVDWRF